MRTEWLQSFIETAKKRSLSKASEALHMTQPALSKQMKKLENDLGATLFIRSASGVELTKAGEILFRESEGILSKVHAVERSIRASEEQGSITIGTWQSMAAFYLPYKLALANDEQPHIDIKIGHHYKDLLTQLDNNEIDAALFDDRAIQHSHWSKGLLKEPFYLFVNEQHPLAGNKSVSFSEFQQEKIVVLPSGCDVRTLVEKEYEHHGINLRISSEIEFAQSIIGFISANLGISILPEIFTKDIGRSNIKALPIEDFHLQRETSLITKNPDVGKKLYKSFFSPGV
ncbi:LysR family transcriptional regulator [Priestia endophytica]|jgi:LysR family transcriptional regulator, transcription activator of glutamate synthase operon|uniref:LysR family transcriptional regulator n=1 Tax=Priestia endophytica TaxID=135735 RepID=UPI002E241213|nr:LysR family transcriptional regulator [Priestia endophytica]